MVRLAIHNARKLAGARCPREPDAYSRKYPHNRDRIILYKPHFAGVFNKGLLPKESMKLPAGNRNLRNKGPRTPEPRPGVMVQERTCHD